MSAHGYAWKAIIFRSGSLFPNATVGGGRTELCKLVRGSEPGLKMVIQNLGVSSLNQVPKYCLFWVIFRRPRDLSAKIFGLNELQRSGSNVSLTNQFAHKTFSWKDEISKLTTTRNLALRNYRVVWCETQDDVLNSSTVCRTDGETDRQHSLYNGAV